MKPMNELRLEWRSPSELAENPRNWRRHFFKQSAAHRTEMGIELDGEIIREYPVCQPVGLLF